MITGRQKTLNLKTLKTLSSPCRLCPRRCLVDRRHGNRGFCGLASQVRMDRALAHHGEEPPLSGSRGAGTIFFSSCNLKCIYCQNHQISHHIQGKRLSVHTLSGIMLALQEQGCHIIEPVTPTPQAHLIMEALKEARRRGLTLPFVYNCGGYEDRDVISLMEGMVDVYLPDFKYGDAETARLFSGVADYPLFAAAALREMVRQTGDRLHTEEGIARKGTLVRHLVLPGMPENSLAVLRAIKEAASTTVALSIMSQYTPSAPMAAHPVLGRRVTRKEYEGVVNAALDFGFENIFIQEVSTRHLSPDFERDDPFDWHL